MEYTNPMQTNSHTMVSYSITPLEPPAQTGHHQTTEISLENTWIYSNEAQLWSNGHHPSILKSGTPLENTYFFSNEHGAQLFSTVLQPSHLNPSSIAAANSWQSSSLEDNSSQNCETRTDVGNTQDLHPYKEDDVCNFITSQCLPQEPWTATNLIYSRNPTLTDMNSQEEFTESDFQNALYSSAVQRSGLTQNLDHLGPHCNKMYMDNGDKEALGIYTEQIENSRLSSSCETPVAQPNDLRSYDQGAHASDQDINGNNFTAFCGSNPSQIQPLLHGSGDVTSQRTSFLEMLFGDHNDSVISLSKSAESSSNHAFKFPERPSKWIRKHTKERRGLKQTLRPKRWNNGLHKTNYAQRKWPMVFNNTFCNSKTKNTSISNIRYENSTKSVKIKLLEFLKLKRQKSLITSLCQSSASSSATLRNRRHQRQLRNYQRLTENQPENGRALPANAVSASNDDPIQTEFDCDNVEYSIKIVKHFINLYHNEKGKFDLLLRKCS